MLDEFDLWVVFKVSINGAATFQSPSHPVPMSHEPIIPDDWLIIRLNQLKARSPFLLLLPRNSYARQMHLLSLTGEDKGYPRHTSRTVMGLQKLGTQKKIGKWKWINLWSPSGLVFNQPHILLPHWLAGNTSSMFDDMGHWGGTLWQQLHPHTPYRFISMNCLVHVQNLEVCAPMRTSPVLGYAEPNIATPSLPDIPWDQESSLLRLPRSYLMQSPQSPI